MAIFPKISIFGFYVFHLFWLEKQGRNPGMLEQKDLPEPEHQLS